jgi:hypothetical protein
VKDRLLGLAKQFEEASKGAGAGIRDADLVGVGIRLPKVFNSKKYGSIRPAKGWESLCAAVYEKLSGEPHPGSVAHGAGFRSQDFGGAVAALLRKHAMKW